ncbi:MAG TPA: nitrogenase component 1 [Desulfosporosinus sp.]|nr:nitrogenase component 1 [Desulfosporosinus sp.]
MGLREDKAAPPREDRIEAGIAFGGTSCGLAKTSGGCLKNQERGFSQAGLCQMLPSMIMLTTLPETAVIIHGALGCGANGSMSLVGNRLQHIQRGSLDVKDSIWVSTNLSENEVVHGGEEKLEKTIYETYERFKPKALIVVQTCTPAIIGDDVATVVSRVREKLGIPILAAYCEGFKTKVWATGYDVAFHAMVHGFIEGDKEGRPARKKVRNENERPWVNLINLGSVGKPDEDEMIRLLNLIGLDVNIGPNFANRESIRDMTQADLTVSICPTHDDYFVDYLHKEYGIPFVLKDMPIGLDNTRSWLLDIAANFGFEKQAEVIIKEEEGKILKAVAKYKPALEGKRVFLSAGEFRALVTGNLFQELGMEIVGLRSYHHDHFGTPLYEKLVTAQKGKDFTVDIANFQPFELTNLLKKNKPDLFIGHVNDNIWAAKLGIPTITIFRIFDHYIGYRGFYEVAKKTHRILRNSSFSRNLAENTPHPYKKEWYTDNPFKFIKSQPNSDEFVDNLEVDQEGAIVNE